LTRDFDNYAITSLTTAIKQIKKKDDKIAQMGEKIATLRDDATELEYFMFGAVEFQDDIIDKIARATRHMEQLSHSVRDHKPHHVITYSQISVNHS